MKLWFNIFTLLCLLVSSGLARDEARSTMNEGLTLMLSSNYVDASNLFAKSAEQAQLQNLEPATAYYNQAFALTQLGELEAAQDLFNKALATEDLTLQQSTYFNLGNNMYEQTRAQLAQSQADPQQQLTPPPIDEHVSKMEKALGHYKNALRLAPSAKDVKTNLELATRFKKELEQIQQQQQQQNQSSQDDKSEDQQQDKSDEGDQQNEPGDSQNQQNQDEQQDQNESDEQQQASDEQEANNQENQGDSSDEQDAQQQAANSKEGEQELSAQEAKQLLDVMREEEAAAREGTRVMLGRPVPVEKDW